MSPDLAPRSVLPYSDDEIRELYVVASSGLDPDRVIAPPARSPLIVADIVFATLLLYGVVFAAAEYIYGVGTALWVSALSFALVAWRIGSLAKRRPVGVLSAWAWRKARREKLLQDAAFDPHDPKVLRTVVEYLADVPVRRARELVEKIEADREEVRASIQELEQLCATLREETLGNSDNSVNMLLESKHSAALETMRQLRSLENGFEAQAYAAMEAVRPVAELRAKFDRMQVLTDSLGRIQSAHGIAEYASMRLDDHRTELSLLRAVSAAATARLQEIENRVDQRGRAETEIDSL